MPGYAPAGWTTTRHRLRGLGHRHRELTTGLATRARTGRLIDRFRDRLMLPITRPPTATCLGFVGRRHPDLQDRDGGPKYLNTPDTPLFHKGAQLYGSPAARPGTTPVRVEGPMDAIAVSLAGGGASSAPHPRHLPDRGASRRLRPRRPTQRHGPCRGHRRRPRRTHRRPTRLLAPDPARRGPHAASALAGSDPAELLETRGADALQAALIQAQPLSDTLLQERLETLPGTAALRPAVTVLAAAAPRVWDAGAERIAGLDGGARRSRTPGPGPRRATLGDRPPCDRRRADQRPVSRAGPLERRHHAGVADQRGGGASTGRRRPLAARRTRSRPEALTSGSRQATGNAAT